jgi:hypothetical protein
MEPYLIGIISSIGFVVVLTAVLVPVLLLLVFKTNSTVKTPTPVAPTVNTPTPTVTPTPTPEDKNYLYNSPNFLLTTTFTTFETIFYGNQLDNYYFSVGVDSKVGTGISLYDVKSDKKVSQVYLSDTSVVPTAPELTKSQLIVVKFQGYYYASFRVETNYLVIFKFDNFGNYVSQYKISNPYGVSITNFGSCCSFRVYKNLLYFYVSGKINPNNFSNGRLFVFLYDLEQNLFYFVPTMNLTISNADTHFGSIFAVNDNFLMVGTQTRVYIFSAQKESWDLFNYNVVTLENTLTDIGFNDGRLFLTTNHGILFYIVNDNGTLTLKDDIEWTVNITNFYGLNDFYIFLVRGPSYSLLNRINNLTLQIQSIYWVKYETETKIVSSASLFYDKTLNLVYFYQNDAKKVYKYILNNACCES